MSKPSSAKPDQRRPPTREAPGSRPQRRPRSRPETRPAEPEPELPIIIDSLHDAAIELYRRRRGRPSRHNIASLARWFRHLDRRVDYTFGGAAFVLSVVAGVAIATA